MCVQERGCKPMKIEINETFGHYEVYIDYEFICSADSYSEARKEIDAFLAQQSKINSNTNFNA